MSKVSLRTERKGASAGISLDGGTTDTKAIKDKGSKTPFDMSKVPEGDTEKYLGIMKYNEHNATGFNGNYGANLTLRDGAGLTVGAYGFTEKSGHINKLLKRYADNGGDVSAVKDVLGSKDWNDDQRNRVKQFVKDNANNDDWKKAQDSHAKEHFVAPAMKLAEEKGITDKKVIAQMADTNLNGGMKSVMKIAEGYGEPVTADTYARARKEYHDQVAARKGTQEFTKGWHRRDNETKDLATKLLDNGNQTYASKSNDEQPVTKADVAELKQVIADNKQESKNTPSSPENVEEQMRIKESNTAQAVNKPNDDGFFDKLDSSSYAANNFQMEAMLYGIHRG